MLSTLFDVTGAQEQIKVNGADAEREDAIVENFKEANNQVRSSTPNGRPIFLFLFYPVRRRNFTRRLSIIFLFLLCFFFFSLYEFDTFSS